MSGGWHLSAPLTLTFPAYSPRSLLKSLTFAGATPPEGRAPEEVTTCAGDLLSVLSQL